MCDKEADRWLSLIIRGMTTLPDAKKYMLDCVDPDGFGMTWNPKKPDEHAPAQDSRSPRFL